MIFQQQQMETISVIGAGLAGSEAALCLADLGFQVNLFEMKPQKKTEAHKVDTFAELVCSNSLKAKRVHSASGLLKAEALALGASLLELATHYSVPAGGALAVDREAFSKAVTDKIYSHPNIKIYEGVMSEIPDTYTLVAAGPLCDDTLFQTLQDFLGFEKTYFFDAAAPLVLAESIDFSKVFLQSRYDRGEADYINCPMDKETYDAFYAALISAETVDIKDFEKKRLFSGCQPVEAIALGGEKSLRFGPLKPVGLRDPKTGLRPYACIQLRQDDASQNLYNMVGFQTRLKFPEQKRIFSMIPGLENAEFMRYGVMHRNSYIHAPSALSMDFSSNQSKRLYFAGQITGLEGYVPAIASGRLAALNMARAILSPEIEPFVLPEFTILGALQRYMTTQTKDYQPMTANFGLLPSLDFRISSKQDRYKALAKRSLEALDNYLEKLQVSCPWFKKGNPYLISDMEINDEAQ